MNLVKLRDKWGVDFKCPFHGRRRLQSPENTKRGAECYGYALKQRMTKGEDPCLKLKKKEEEKVPTFSEFSEEWFVTYSMTTNKPSEQTTKESVLRLHLVPWFGETHLDKITALQIEQFKASRKQKGLCNKTINNILACLGKCLQCAVEWGKIATYPKIKKLPFTSGRVVFLTPVESGKLIQDMIEPLWHDLILLGLRTGMRFGELIGLDWEDVDLKRRIVTVRQSIVKGVLTTPKNGKIRHIDISTDLHDMLAQHVKKTGFVFRLQDRKEITNHVALNALRRACKRVGVKRISWHILRHTFASHLVMSGVPLPAVQQLLGHSSIVMTMKYAHLAPSITRSAVEKLHEGELKELVELGNQMPTEQIEEKLEYKNTR